MSVGSLKVKIFDTKGTNLIPVAKSTVTVGSASHCDVVLEHDSVQGEHVRAWLEGGRIWIQDLGTTGGTFLNGIRLPSLKPMLVRDLDVLKLGESPATIGLEANLVRAPVVKTQSTVEGVTLTDIRTPAAKDPELEKRREELAKVSRELAELKLQLQMGRLEKNSTEELRKQITTLREELRQLGEQRDKMTDTLKRLEDEKHARISSTEAEIVDMKLKAERDIRDMRDSHGRKLGHWKVDAVAELNRQLQAITKQKQKAWATRPVSQDMVFEIESELNLVFRRVLLEENKHPEVPAEHTHTWISRPDIGVAEQEEITRTRSKVEAPPEVPAATAAASANGTSTRTRSKKKRSKSRYEASWGHRAALVGLVVAFLSVVAWLAKPYIRKSAVRNLASTAPNQATPPPARYQPKQNKLFKKTYTENILFTESYADAELNSDWRQRWTADLTKVARNDWKIDEKAIASLAGKEQQLIQDLQRLRDTINPQREQEGIARMRARESTFQQELLTLLKSPQQVEKFQKLKRSFFTRNQAYLVRQSR